MKAFWASLLLFLAASGMQPTAAAQRQSPQSHGADPTSRTISTDSADSEAVRQIHALEEELRQATMKNDVAAIDRILADDYVYVSIFGNPMPKSQIVGAYRNRDVKVEGFNVKEEKVRVYGDAAVVTAHVTMRGRSKPEGDFTGPYFYTRVYVKQRGVWRAVSFQATASQ